MAACGATDTTSANSAPSSSPSVNAAVRVICNLVSTDQAQTAAAVPFPSKPAAIAKAHGAECRYDVPKGLVSVEVEDSLGVDAGRAAFTDAHSQALPGLGDEAVWNPGFQVLWIRKGNSALTIQLVSQNIADKDTLRNNAVTLANQILPKLQTS